MRRKALATLAAVFFAGIWGATLGFINLRGDARLLDRVEGAAVDLRTLIRGPLDAPRHITIVAIDDQLAKEQGYPLKRSSIARLIEEIAQFSPAIIAVDMLLVDPADPAGDAQLAQTLAKGTTAIAAAAIFPDGKQWVPPQAEGLERIPSAESLLMPLPLFARASEIGVVNMATDEAGAPRYAPLLFRSGQELVPSLPLRVAAIKMGAKPEFEDGRVILGELSLPADLGLQIPLSFYGPRGSIHTISAATVLAGQASLPEISNDIVVIGVTVTGGGDVFPTPFDPILPGVEVVSTAIAHLTSGDGPVKNRQTRLADLATATLLPMILVGLIAWRRSVVALCAVVGVLLLWAGINMLFFLNGVWLSFALPLASAAPPAVLFGATQLWLDRNRARYFAEQSALLQRVNAPGLGGWLARHGDFLLKPARVEAAVIFVDLSGFTRLSEQAGPIQTRELLNRFHHLVDDEVTRSGGIVTSFMGDGAMIVFGLPESAPDDARNAVECCLRLSRHMQHWIGSMDPPSNLGHKIGAHFGTIVASRLGGENHQHIAATGDTVNVANRLMEVAAKHGCTIAFSQDMLKAAGTDSPLYGSGVLKGPIETNLRGRSGSIAIWLWLDQDG